MEYITLNNGKSNAQVILRWHIQSDHVVIHGSKTPYHIKDNFDIFDFSLSDKDMEEIAKLNKNTPYYTATPEMITAYASMELKEDLLKKIVKEIEIFIIW